VRPDTNEGFHAARGAAAIGESASRTSTFGKGDVGKSSTRTSGSLLKVFQGARRAGGDSSSREVLFPCGVTRTKVSTRGPGRPRSVSQRAGRALSEKAKRARARRGQVGVR